MIRLGTKAGWIDVTANGDNERANLLPGISLPRPEQMQSPTQQAGVLSPGPVTFM